MTLGEKIKFYRNKLNYSQEQLANKCNLSRNAIYNYENNKRTPTISTLKVIVENLNISFTDILAKTDNIYNSLNVIEPSKAIDKCAKVNNSVINHYDFEMNELYKKYFFDLFNWKTRDMTPDDYFKFIISLYPLKEIEHMTEEDINELSALFYRFLTLIAIKSKSINRHKKSNPDNYERN